jgi:hypothetical protein
LQVLRNSKALFLYFISLQHIQDGKRGAGDDQRAKDDIFHKGPFASILEQSVEMTISKWRMRSSFSFSSSLLDFEEDDEHEHNAGARIRGFWQLALKLRPIALHSMFPIFTSRKA